MFTTAHFENIVPRLMLNRQAVDVLVHLPTDNSYDDHSRYAVWLAGYGAVTATAGYGLRRRVTVTVYQIVAGRR